MLSLSLPSDLRPSVQAPLGLAVSGGSDSMALLHLTAQRFPPDALTVATVNHGLRAAAAAEAQCVAQHCAALGIAHQTLVVQGLAQGPNLQARARSARYAALAEWGGHCCAIALGHTAQDVAETFLLRLKRGSGLEGLAAMSANVTRDGIRWLRPILTCDREALRDVLRKAGHRWCDDPSNEDTNFDRVALRTALPALSQLGFDPRHLAQTAHRLAEARDVVRDVARVAFDGCVTLDIGDAIVDRAALMQHRPEVQFRILACLFRWIGNQDYPPRAKALRRSLATTNRHTLHGTLVLPLGDTLRLTREYARVPPECASVWDGRWRTRDPDVLLRALGPDGLTQVPQWRGSGRPRDSLLASPSAWKGSTLVAAPYANFGAGPLIERITYPLGFRV